MVDLNLSCETEVAVKFDSELIELWRQTIPQHQQELMTGLVISTMTHHKMMTSEEKKILTVNKEQR